MSNMLSSDEQQYLLRSEKDRRTTHRWLGSCICLAVILLIVFSDLPSHVTDSDFFMGVFWYVLLLISGIKILVSSFVIHEPTEPEYIEGTFYETRRNRHRSFMIDDKTVILPPAWNDYLTHGEYYRFTVCKIQKRIYILSIEPMMEELADKTLLQWYEEGKAITNEALRGMFRFIRTAAIVAAVIYGLYVFLFRINGTKILEIFEQFAYEHPDALDAAGTFLTRGGGIVIVILVFFAVSIISSAKKISGKKKKLRQEEIEAVNVHSWLQEYRAFITTYKESLTQPVRTIDCLKKARQKAQQLSTFRSEYKALCRRLSGSERTQFVQDCKNIRSQF